MLGPTPYSFPEQQCTESVGNGRIGDDSGLLAERNREDYEKTSNPCILLEIVFRVLEKTSDLRDGGLVITCELVDSPDIVHGFVLTPGIRNRGDVAERELHEPSELLS